MNILEKYKKELEDGISMLKEVNNRLMDIDGLDFIQASGQVDCNIRDIISLAGALSQVEEEIQSKLVLKNTEEDKHEHVN